MKKENNIKPHHHEIFFNALRNKTAMKKWDQEETLPVGISPRGRAPLLFPEIPFSAGTPGHGIGLTQQRGFGKAQEQLRQMGWRGSTLHTKCSRIFGHPQHCSRLQNLRQIKYSGSMSSQTSLPLSLHLTTAAEASRDAPKVRESGDFTAT